MELQQIKTGNDNISIITDKVIESIAKIKAFHLTQMNEELYKLHKKLLSTAKNKNKSYEVGMFWNLSDTDECFVIYGTMNGIDMNKNEEVKKLVTYGPICSIAVLHNHPRNGLFSSRDISSFIEYNSIYLLTAVCNDGTIYMLRKEANFNPFLLREYYNQGIKKNRRKSLGNKPCYYGIKNVAKHAKEIGVTYRCSVRRKEMR